MATAPPRPWNVLVTGAGGDIGRATAVALAEAGATVVCVDRNEAAARETTDAIGGAAHALVADLSDIPGLDALLDRTTQLVGPLDTLVQLAAVLRRQRNAEVTEADWDLQFDINAKAAFFLSRGFAERLRAEGRPGTVVNTASQSWSTGGLEGAIVYAATKGALVTMTRGMARAYAADGIRFNAVAPGFIDTRMLRSDLTPEAMDGLVAQVPLGRFAETAEVAQTILFLASPASSYVTGSTIVVAGGQLMH